MPNGQLKISTISNMELVNITSEIDKVLQSQPISSGVIHLFNPHTTAGLIINEGADPDVCLDILQGLGTHGSLETLATNIERAIRRPTL